MPPLIFILNGPNLNLLGEREPAVYGRESLADLAAACREEGELCGVAVEFRQTNHEGVLVDWLQEARHAAQGLVLNAGAYTHTSIAVLDALSVLTMPVIEVHLSNIFRREAFRHQSYVSMAATGVIAGLGSDGYRAALRVLARRLAA